ncbi:class I SAM-dependent methyltransferase [Geomonas subterranea]|uniref:class I SAM-dependent methyltransferase n=1 Tax=Geomonas subterranea TaxID=2847989 RepID=UPI001CD26BBC|nr:class I SAM-dependent methyltransferase [Geomonas fuzhouensis]
MSQPENLTAFYDAAWDKWNDMIRYSPAPRFRRTRILSWVRELAAPRTLLDVGCGNGEFLLQASRELQGTEFAGADVSPAVIEANRAQLPGMNFATLDLNREELPGRYDVVTCMEVVEHCADHREAIARLAAMTGQWLFVTVPCGPLFEIDRRVGHTRHFSPGEIREALEAAGLTVVRCQAWGFPFFNLYKHLINLNPDLACAAFLESGSYSAAQKLLASLVYVSFRLSLPFGGYQLLVAARRR